MAAYREMAEYSAGNIKHAGEWFKLRVNDNGDWLTKVDGQDISQPTRAKLVSEIDRLMRLKKKAVNIPFTKVESKNNGYVTLKHGVVTGVHSGTGNLLVAWDEGGNGQLIVGFGADVMQRLSIEDERKLIHLTRDAYRASEELREFTQRRAVYKGTKGLADQVEAELKKAEGKR
jgi:hypothetical protein